MKPAASALAFLRRKQLKPAFDYRDVWQEEHHLHFTVAKAMRLDILEAIYQAVMDATRGSNTAAVSGIADARPAKEGLVGR